MGQQHACGSNIWVFKFYELLVFVVYLGLTLNNLKFININPIGMRVL